MIELIQTKRTDPRLLARMQIHYSQPRGFVGRNICYAVLYDGVYYGHIVGGSTAKWLPGRDASALNNIVNNLFYSVAKVNERYPTRNFSSRVVEAFCERVRIDWFAKYGDKVTRIETLVEPPRTGELYIRAGFTFVGQTKGFTCKRVAGRGSDSYGGRRVWDTQTRRPKNVFARTFEVAQ